MDAQVEQALAKWPNVPHCYGWLGLDARGNWRMRDEQAQKQGRLGERIAHATLIAFINRNYACDAQGCWYFQNGPQRVYVELEGAPYIARLASDTSVTLHTGDSLQQLEAVYLSDSGRLWLQGSDKIALLDDRDLAQCLPLLSVDGQAIDDEMLHAWLTGGASGQLQLTWRQALVHVQHLLEADAPNRFGFVRSPCSKLGAAPA
jgi:hypothetical protein